MKICSEHLYRRRIEFHETDMAGIVHSTSFFRYMEEAEHDFYRAVGFDLGAESFEQSWGLPRVHAECDFLNPARFQEILDVRLEVEELGSRAVRYSFEFSRGAGRERTAIATGALVVCFVSRDSGARSFAAAPFPAAFRERIGVGGDSTTYSGSD